MRLLWFRRRSEEEGGTPGPAPDLDPELARKIEEFARQRVEGAVNQVMRDLAQQVREKISSAVEEEIKKHMSNLGRAIEAVIRDQLEGLLTQRDEHLSNQIALIGAYVHDLSRSVLGLAGAMSDLSLALSGASGEGATGSETLQPRLERVQAAMEEITRTLEVGIPIIEETARKVQVASRELAYLREMSRFISGLESKVRELEDKANSVQERISDLKRDLDSAVEGAKVSLTEELTNRVIAELVKGGALAGIVDSVTARVTRDLVQMGILPERPKGG